MTKGNKSMLTIVNDIDNGKVLAYRNKTSIEIFHNTKEVGFNDFTYTWEEIVEVGKKLKKMLEKDLVNVP